VTGRALRILGVAGALLATLLLARHAVAQSPFTFRAPHAVRAPTAHLAPALAEDLDAQARKATPATLDDLVAFALRATSSALHFGLSHRTRLTFDGVEREGNCVEYAELFATIVNRAHGGEDLRAWVVRSDAAILGETSKSPAWRDHDWVLVVAHTPAGPRRLYVDPTLYDMGLGWDISRAVLGDVQVSSPER
jgi:hypothetical protein